MLRIGLQEYDWVIGGIVTRAKSTLAASAIVLGVMIAGLGGFAWILNAGGATDVVIHHLRASQMMLPVALFGVGGFGSMLWAAYYSVSALYSREKVFGRFLPVLFKQSLSSTCHTLLICSPRRVIGQPRFGANPRTFACQYRRGGDQEPV